jgi:hypothetical protein
LRRCPPEIDYKMETTVAKCCQDNRNSILPSVPIIIALSSLIITFCLPRYNCAQVQVLNRRVMFPAQFRPPANSCQKESVHRFVDCR